MKKLFLLVFALSSLNFVYASELDERELAPQDYVEEVAAEDIDLRRRERLERKSPVDHPVLSRHLNSYDEFILFPNQTDEGLVLKKDFDEDFTGFSTLYKFKLVGPAGMQALELEKLFNYRKIYGVYNIRGRLLVYYQSISGHEVRDFIN